MPVVGKVWQSDIWETTLRLRAYENGFFHVGIGKAGVEDGLPYVGDSVVITPLGGDVIARAKTDATELVLAEMRDGPAAARYLELNQQFHTMLYERSGRPQLVEMIAALRDASSAYLHIYRAQSDFPVARLDEEHHAILTACVARDPERAAAATRAHLENTVEHVAAHL